MTPLRWFIVLFWVVVVFMLLKGCYDSETNRAREAQLHPTPQQYFFAPTPGQPSGAPSPAAPAAAKVIQTGFVIEPETPPGSFTCRVTLKNVGGMKATGVQIRVRPYRGSKRGEIDIGPQHPPLSENDPLSQMDAFLSFPDLAPGESSTQPTTFMNQVNIEPGKNPDPEIDFKSAGAQP